MNYIGGERKDQLWVGFMRLRQSEETSWGEIVRFGHLVFTGKNAVSFHIYIDLRVPVTSVATQTVPSSVT